MKTSLTSKIIISNILVLVISFTALFVAYNFENKVSEDILLHRNQVNQFDKEVILVASYLYRSAHMNDDKYLAEAAISSKKAIYTLDFLIHHEFQTQELKAVYIDFFKNAVIATSLSLENRSNKAQEVDAISFFSLLYL